MAALLLDLREFVHRSHPKTTSAGELSLLPVAHEIVDGLTHRAQIVGRYRSYRKSVDQIVEEAYSKGMKVR